MCLVELSEKSKIVIVGQCHEVFGLQGKGVAIACVSQADLCHTSHAVEW